MSLKHLTRVEISNFRAYPSTFSLELPGPGATILVGSNGLGKTSFFEALEWALTGKVERLSERPTEGDKLSPADYYARIRGDGTREGAYSVSLFMSDRSVFTRQVRNGSETQATSASEIARALRAEDSRLSISDVWLYLRQTHFLCQAPERRFTALEPEQRWNKIRGPVGVEGLSVAHAGLGQGTMHAFTRYLRDAERRHEEANAAIATWADRIQRRDALATQTAAGGGLTLAEAAAWLMGIEKTLGLTRPEAANFEPASQEEINDRFHDLVLKLQRTDEDTTRGAKALQRLAPLASEWRTALVQEQAAEEAQHAALEERQAKALSVDAAVLATAASEAESSTCRGNLARAQRFHDVIRGVLQAMEDRVAARTSLEEEIARRLQTADDLGAIQMRRRTHDEMLKAVRMRGEELLALRARQRAFHVALEALEAWQTCNDLARNASIAKAEIEDQQEGILSLKQSLEKQIHEVGRQIRSADGALDELRARAGAVRAAVSTIAAHLTDDSRLCPACSTTFEHAEALHSAVAKTLGATDDVLLSAERASATLRETLRSLRTNEASLVERQHELVSKLNEIAELQRTADEHWAALVALPVVGSGEAGEIEALLREQAELTERQLATRQKEETGREADALEQEIRRLRDQEQAAEKLYRVQEDRIRQFSLQVEEAEAYLRRHLKESAELADSDLHSRELRLRAAMDVVVQEKHSLSVLESATSDRRADVARAQAALRVAEEKLASANAELVAIHRRQEGILNIWRSGGLDGTPEERALDERRRDLEARRATLAEAEHSRRRLWERWQSGLAQGELHRQQREIEQIRQGRTEAEHSTHLAMQVGRARDRLTRVAQARSEAEVLRAQLEEKTSRYLTEVLRPLRKLVESYFRALSIFPEWDVDIDTTTKRNRTLVGMTVHPMQKAGKKAAQHFSARHLLSEGQMSAVALSQLFAMSTAYRWSGWRALLLDDPLQHNDVIHAAALIDVIRNLIIAEQYQVVVSTHDLGVADFFRRKLHAGGVPCTTCHFRGVGTNGLIHALE